MQQLRLEDHKDLRCMIGGDVGGVMQLLRANGTCRKAGDRIWSEAGANDAKIVRYEA